MKIPGSQTSCGSHLPAGMVLDASFFARPSHLVAPQLVGKILWRCGVGGGRLVEVEAYLPEADPACHASRGRTARNAVMFGPPGHVYVYLSYGLHHLLNLVCDRPGAGSAVLVRAFEPVGDVGRLRANRGDSLETMPLESLTSGPGRVGQALGLDLSWNGLPLGETTGLLVIDDGDTPAVISDSRIGISTGADLPLRFFAAGNRFVSRASKRGRP